MLDILGLIFVAAAFNHLAHIFNKSRILYTLLGIGIYILSFIVIMTIINFLIYNLEVKSLARLGPIIISFIGMGLSFLACLLAYKSIKSSFIRREKEMKEEVLDQGV